MRSFKQLFINLILYGCNTYTDGIKVEQYHQLHKDDQINHNNNQYQHKDQVTDRSCQRFVNKFVINGGRWGPNLQYHLGEQISKLKNPKNPALPNDAVQPFLFAKGCKMSTKFQVTQLYGKKLKPKQQKPYQRMLAHGKSDELMLLINAAADWSDANLSLSQIHRSPKWSIRRVKNFIFHASHCSVAINMNTTNKCNFKTNNNFVFQFQNVYELKYLNTNQILVAYGKFWQIVNSDTKNQWVGDEFESMDSINIKKYTKGWCFATNLEEPVFIFHRCVPFSKIQKTLPRQWRRQDHKSFTKNYVFNMHKLIKCRAEIGSARERQKIHLPCGPVYKCKRHNVVDCRTCLVEANVYPDSDWTMKWMCNHAIESRYWIYDSKNGLCMSRIKPVRRDKMKQF